MRLLAIETHTVWILLGAPQQVVHRRNRLRISLRKRPTQHHIRNTDRRKLLGETLVHPVSDGLAIAHAVLHERGIGGTEQIEIDKILRADGIDDDVAGILIALEPRPRSESIGVAKQYSVCTSGRRIFPGLLLGRDMDEVF